MIIEFSIRRKNNYPNLAMIYGSVKIGMRTHQSDSPIHTHVDGTTESTNFIALQEQQW